MANATTTEEESDDGFGSIAILMRTTTSSRSSTQSNKSKKSVETPPPTPAPEPVPEWEQVGMTKEDYETLCQKIAKQKVEDEIASARKQALEEVDTIEYWERRIESLERYRERFNKKRGWSSEVMDEVEEIDKSIADCEEEIARIQKMYPCECDECYGEEEEEEMERCAGCGKWEPVGSMDSCSGYGNYCSRSCGPAGYYREYEWN
jgi:hypothetical protein